jgi:iron complex transport system substrate-binding protein
MLACYEMDDTAFIIAEREAIMTRPELTEVTAVKSGRVYAIECMGFVYGPSHIAGLAYMAKWCHPDLFEDLDPQAIHQEYLTRFQGLDYDLDKHGVFVYHPELHPDGK